MLPQPSLDQQTQIICDCQKKGNKVLVLLLCSYLRLHGLDTHRVLGNSLVSLLVEFRSIHDAEQLFDRLMHRNDFSWNSLVMGYTKCDKLDHALCMYEKLQMDTSLHLSGQMSIILLKACAKLGELERGLQIHAEVSRRALLEKDVFIGSTLIDMYVKCGSLPMAHDVLNRLQVQNVVCWNALISGYASHGYGEQALQCLDMMQPKGVPPDAVTFLCSLKACGSIMAIVKGRQLHAEIERKGLLKVDAGLGNTLVDMYIKCGWFAIAQQVLHGLPVRDVISWTSLIAGYAEHGVAEMAMKCFEQMQLEGISPDGVALVCGLKACSTIEPDDLDNDRYGAKQKEAERDCTFANPSADMCAAKAHNILDEHTMSGTASCIALLTDYAEHILTDYAERMVSEDSLEAEVEGTRMLACNKEGLGSVHVQKEDIRTDAVLAIRGMETNVGNSLVVMYAKHGALIKAQQVFDRLPSRDKVSWNALIAGYAEHCHGREALKHYKWMQMDGFIPDVITYVCCLKACGSIGALDTGLEIHHEIIKRGLVESDLVVGNILVDMYAKCGCLVMAHHVFDRLPVQEVVSWTTLLAGYVQHGQGEDAIEFFEQMQSKSIIPDVATLLSVIKACVSLGAIDKSQEVHAEIARKGLGRDLVVGNTLIGMYAKCGSLLIAEEVLDGLPIRDVVSWNAIIAGYVEHSHSVEALHQFEHMQLEGVSPDAATYASILKACGKIRVPGETGNILSEIKRKGLLGKDIYIGSILVDTYAKCGSLADARLVFDELPLQDVSSWNALISAHIQHGYGELALQQLNRMKLQGVSPNSITLMCSLRACGRIGAADEGQALHTNFAKKGLLQNELRVSNTLVDMYAKCGLLAAAREVFDELLVRDVITWTTLMAGYVEHCYGEEALECFECMKLQGIVPDMVMLSCCLKACGSMGASVKGQEVHSEIISKGLMETDVLVGNMIVDMYSRLGYPIESQKVLNKLPARDCVSWNAFLTGCARLGETKRALRSFDDLVELGIKPDQTTFNIVLNVCSRSSLPCRSQAYLEVMRKDFHIVPGREHHACMVDLLSRSGKLDMAAATINDMPFRPNAVIWRILLGACRTWGNEKLGEHVLTHAICCICPRILPVCFTVFTH